MQGPVLVQDWVTLKGQGAGSTSAATFYPHRQSWLWAGDARRVALTVEVKALTGATTAPALRIETAACEAGPWVEVASYTTVGDRTLWLRREPGDTADEQVLGYLRWALAEDDGVGGSGAWTACFRIVAVLEGASA